MKAWRKTKAMQKINHLDKLKRQAAIAKIKGTQVYFHKMRFKWKLKSQDGANAWN